MFENGNVTWQVVDQALRGIAVRRATLDAEEARWLRQAEELRIWKPLGLVSALDYMERVLGYAPRSAQERLRVARALGELPVLEAALGEGTLAYSAVRELTRVATPENEVAWRDAAVGMNVRQIEELVADHKLGDGPGDPKDPKARVHVVRLELSAETFARLRQARQGLEDEHGAAMSDDELVAALCEGALEVHESEGRAKFQVAVTVCEKCKQGWQEGAGAKIAIGPAAVERAMCDAQHVGSIDGDAPERAYQDVAPSVARLVRRRDGGRCRTPGCRSARGLEIHHVVHREHDGGHDAGNLILLCSSCHMAHHRGLLIIEGTAKELVVRRAHKLDAAISESRAHVGGDGEAREVRRAHKLDAVIAESRAHVGGDGEASEVRQAHKLDAAIAESRVHVGSDGIAREARSAHKLDAAIAESGAHVGGDGEARGVRRAHKLDAAIAESRAHVGGDGEAREVRRAHKLDAAIAESGAHVGGDGEAREARRALVGMGWSKAIAEAAVEDARGAVGDAGLEKLIFEALRRCPRPRAA